MSIFDILSLLGGLAMFLYTLSDNGTVTRGVCQSNESGILTGVTETYKVSRHDGIVDGYV